MRGRGWGERERGRVKEVDQHAIRGDETRGEVESESERRKKRQKKKEREQTGQRKCD